MIGGSKAWRFRHLSRGFLLPNPKVPEDPSQYRPCSAPTNNRHWRDALLEDTNEAADEERNRADVLDYDGGIRYKRPEIVGL